MAVLIVFFQIVKLISSQWDSMDWFGAGAIGSRVRIGPSAPFVCIRSGCLFVSYALRKARNDETGPARPIATAMWGTAPRRAPRWGSAMGWPQAEESAGAFPSGPGWEMAWGWAPRS